MTITSNIITDATLSVNIVRRVKALFIDKYSPAPTAAAVVPPIAATDSGGIMGLLMKKRKVSAPLDESLGDEFERYIRISLSDGDPLSWWSTNASAYPRLALMARDFLAIPGTETSSERAFSSARRLISWERNRLGDNTIRACECVKSWLEALR